MRPVRTSVAAPRAGFCELDHWNVSQRVPRNTKRPGTGMDIVLAFAPVVASFTLGGPMSRDKLICRFDQFAAGHLCGSQ